MHGFCSLHSGSKGNSLYLGSSETKILIDCGVSYKKIVSALGQLSIDPSEIDAIFITHDHHDHVSGLKSFLAKHCIPVIANHCTAQALMKQHDLEIPFQLFMTGEPFTFKDLSIDPFSIPHDTDDPVGFIFSIGPYKMGICTDIGFPTALAKQKLRACDYLFIESNHDPHMVHASDRPAFYKKRVLSRSGHLSNEQCALLLQDCLSDNLKHVILAHLSQECNTPEKAYETIRAILPQSTKLSVSLQDEIGHQIGFA